MGWKDRVAETQSYYSQDPMHGPPAQPHAACTCIFLHYHMASSSHREGDDRFEADTRSQASESKQLIGEKSKMMSKEKRKRYIHT